MKIAPRKFVFASCLFAAGAVALLFAAVPPGPAADCGTKGGAQILKLSGRVEAYEQTKMYSRIVGLVKTVNVDIGDRVKLGQVLAEQAVPQLEAELDQKKALAAQAEAQVLHAHLLLKESKTSLLTAAAHIKEAEAAVRTAQTKVEEAKAAYERIKKLFEEKVIDPKGVEERALNVELAKAGLEEARSHVQTAKATYESGENSVAATEIGIKSATAQRDAANAAAALAAAMLGYAKITAPFDGVVTQRMVHTGALAGPPGARGEPLFTVSRVDLVRVVIAVPENSAASVRPGAKAVVQIGAQEFKGTIARTAGAIDPQTGALRVEIDLPNADGRLLPGMSAQVSVSVVRE